MFSNRKNAGTHMITDITNIRRDYSVESMMCFIDYICEMYGFGVQHKYVHRFDKQKAFSITYVLSESHIAVHTFPEQNAMMWDLYCCREYNEFSCPYSSIEVELIKLLDARVNTRILVRKFDTPIGHSPQWI